MSTYGTVLGQGTFVANSVGLANPNPGNATVGTSNAAYIQIPSGADWIKVRNYTQFGKAGTSGAYFSTNNAYPAFEFFWQYGMPAGSALVSYKANTTSVVNSDQILSGGFTLYDPSGQTQGSQPLLGSPVAITAGTNATRPVMSTASTAGVSVGSVVRISSTAQSAVNGIDFVVGAVTANTSITLMAASNALATAPGDVAGANGFYSIVYNANNALFYPRRRYVTNITQAANAQVSTSIAHGLTPGQAVRFNIPSVSGMVQLNPQKNNFYFPTSATSNAVVVSVVDDYNFTININTSAYTAFTSPTDAQEPVTYPTVVPFGEDTATAIASLNSQTPTIAGQKIYNTQTGILADATVNTGFLGMILGSGGVGTVLTTPILGPSGTIAWSAGNVPTGDIMYWVAGKSLYGAQ